MRFKTIPIAAASIVTAIFAETPSDTANFDVIHGNSYSYIQYTSELAFYRDAFSYALPSIAPTVSELVNMPHRMNGQRFVYFEPANGYAVASFAFNESTSFLSMENPGGGNGRATLGIATKNMGLSFTMSTNDHIELYEEKSPFYKREIDTYGGSTWDSYQLHFSFPTNSYDFSTKFVFTRTNATDSLYSEVYKDSEGKEEKTHDTHHYTLWAQALLTNRPSARRFFWKGQLDLLRFNHDIDSSFTSTIDPDKDYSYNVRANGNISHLYLSYAFSYIALKNPNARVHLGAVSQFRFWISDRLEDKTNQLKDNWFGTSLLLYPGIWAEYALNENWMIWGATTYSWATSYTHETYIEHWKDEDEAKNTLDRITSETNSLGLKTGLRFNYHWITLEASLYSAFYSNPLRGFDSKNFLSNLSGSITF